MSETPRERPVRKRQWAPDLIDARCDCAECASEQRSHDLPGKCSNCGYPFMVRNRFGDEQPLHVDCPHCGHFGLWVTHD